MEKKKTVQCIDCGARSDDKVNKIIGSVPIQFLEDLSKEKELDCELVMCDACVIGNALFALGAQLDPRDSPAHKIVSDALVSAASTFSIDYRRRRF